MQGAATAALAALYRRISSVVDVSQARRFLAQGLAL